MATLVISPEIEQDVQRLASVRGITPAEAVAEAVRNQLQSIHSERNPRGVDRKALHAFLDGLEGPVDYTLTDDQILGYDEFGTPEQPWCDGPR